MAQTKLNGAEQIKANSVGSGQVDSTVLVAGGTNALSGDLSMGGNKLTNVGTPTASTDATNKSYVDAAVQGFDWKASVRAATTANGTLASAFANGSVVDGVTLATGDRILLKNQTTAQDNGIYTVNASGAPTRAADADTSAKVTAGMAVFASEGTINGNTAWLLTTDDPITLGTTTLVFAQIAGGATGSVTSVSVVSANGFAGSVATSTTTPAITVSTSITANVLKGNGTALQAAVAGTDYLAPSSWVANETPSGTVNGANTAFTLANTPNANVTNPIMLYINGSLLEPGAGNDYTVSGTTITMLWAPATGDKIRAYYWK